MKLKDKPKAEKIRIITVVAVILAFILLGVFTPVLFPGTKFAVVINNTIGKFFNIAKFFQNNYMIILESIAIIIFIWIIYKILALIVMVLMNKKQKRQTIGNLVISFFKYLMVVVAIFLILSAWGVQTPTLLAGAGILGLAVSFGAQSLIEDIFAGLFIIFEKQFSVGDVIQVGEFRGIVKEIGIRITKFEDINGDIKMINNSDIRGAINSSNVLSQAICEISISYNENIEKFEEFMKENIKDMKDQIPTIKKGPFYDGIETFGDSGITIRIVAWVRETDRLRTVRDMNKAIKVLFDKNNIEIPYPQLVVHKEKEQA